MKKFFEFCVLACFYILINNANSQWVSNSINSSSAWKWINPYPSNKTLTKTVFLNEYTGFTIIDSRIFRSTNGGVNWNIPGDTNSGNSSIYFQNINTGYKICTGGICKTTNAGVNWNYFVNYTNPSGGITNIASISENYFMYSVTTYQPPFNPVGSIWYSSNNGNNWSVFYPGAFYITSLNVVSNNLAIGLAVDTNKLYFLTTTNPAAGWNKVFTGIYEPYSAYLHIKDSVTYFITIPYGATYKTVNAGQNWVSVPLTEIRSMKFPGSDIGIAVGEKGKIYRSTDGCQTWHSIQFPVFYNYESVTFFNSQSGYITGDFGSLLKTTNGGANWFSDSKYFTKQNIRDVKIIGKDSVIICSDSGYIFSSFNQGVSWNIQKPGQNNLLTKIFFLNKNTGYVIGRNSTILKTTNTGVNWVSLNSGISETFMFDIFFTDENTGYLASDHLYKTTNGGNNFYSINPSGIFRIYNVKFLNANTGFFANSAIYKTTDAGLNWVLVNSPQLTQSIFDIEFINSNTGFAVGEYGYLIKTTDGGQNWFQKEQLNHSGLYSIKFVNSQTGFITTGGGSWNERSKIFFSTNSGENWNNTILDPDVSSNIIYSIDFTNDSVGYAVGEYGIVLKTITGGIVGIKKTETNIPKNFKLSQNYPNPFNPVTNIKYQITNNKFVSLKVFDILGKEIETLVNEKQSAGTYEVNWDALQYPSGVYFYRLVTDGFTDSKKMILLK